MTSTPIRGFLSPSGWGCETTSVGYVIETFQLYNTDVATIEMLRLQNLLRSEGIEVIHIGITPQRLYRDGDTIKRQTLLELLDQPLSIRRCPCKKAESLNRGTVVTIPNDEFRRPYHRGRYNPTELSSDTTGFSCFTSFVTELHRVSSVTTLRHPWRDLLKDSSRIERNL